jgi:hypothetical protein
MNTLCGCVQQVILTVNWNTPALERVLGEGAPCVFFFFFDLTGVVLLDAPLLSLFPADLKK